MEPEVSLFYSQEPATCLCPGRDELIVLFNVFFTSFYLLMCLYFVVFLVFTFSFLFWLSTFIWFLLSIKEPYKRTQPK